MKVYSIFRSGCFFVLLCLFIVEGKRSPTGKHTCRKGLLFQVTENLYIKATSLKSSVPKDVIKNTRLLKKTTKMLFMTNCSVRDQLLSFYAKNVFTHLGVGSEQLYVISAFHALQENLSTCGGAGAPEGVPDSHRNQEALEHPFEHQTSALK
uniref:IL26 protein n=1 Tax=Apteryx owenii TaxID=8824 RepID=A0A8B9PTD6_APTOW